MPVSLLMKSLRRAIIAEHVLDQGEIILRPAPTARAGLRSNRGRSGASPLLPVDVFEEVVYRIDRPAVIVQVARLGAKIGDLLFLLITRE